MTWPTMDVPASPSPRRRAVPLVAVLAVADGLVAAFVAARPGSVPSLVVALRDASRDVRAVVPPENGRAPIADGARALDRAVRSSRAAPVDGGGFSS